ncbi:hypothetical protein B0T24DRAFT_695603 [Lasiosphaeria ovina]|uniref:DUF8212 domain-containing protein n=1 Tax=Lasiosphaeria ovina TaxID=92902 RepID=A0AAE0TSG1_9PEZI|nr:hypothetical protein B0T24DRAFT_695603 [Lasiosphaeria ovina]
MATDSHNHSKHQARLDYIRELLGDHFGVSSQDFERTNITPIQYGPNHAFKYNNFVYRLSNPDADGMHQRRGCRMKLASSPSPRLPCVTLSPASCPASSAGELIAPSRLNFFNRAWSKIGEKGDLTSLLESVTGIDESVLQGGPMDSISIGRRMSWASRRQTTRPEDIAYCLMGIFDVNMPMLYGEGGTKAFIRLQEEILRESDDQTILAWSDTSFRASTTTVCGLLAPSPRYFANFLNGAGSATLRPFQLLHDPVTSLSLTNRGLHIRGSVEDLNPEFPMCYIRLGLNCAYRSFPMVVAGINLMRVKGDQYVRANPEHLYECGGNGTIKTIYGLRSVKSRLHVRSRSTLPNSVAGLPELQNQYGLWTFGIFRMALADPETILDPRYEAHFESMACFGRLSEGLLLQTKEPESSKALSTLMIWWSLDTQSAVILLHCAIRDDEGTNTYLLHAAHIPDLDKVGDDFGALVVSPIYEMFEGPPIRDSRAEYRLSVGSDKYLVFSVGLWRVHGLEMINVNVNPEG